jgi:hypothetical protein
MSAIKVFVLVSIFALQANAMNPLYTPQEAVKDALSSPLRFKDSYIPNFSESGLRSAIFQNDKVLVSVDYCVPGPIQAASIRIHSRDQSRGNVKIYAETTPGTDVSKAKRSTYFDVTWSNGARPNGEGFMYDGDGASYKAYVEVEARKMNGCVSGKTSPVFCMPGFEDQKTEWGKAGHAFWVNPGSNWYRLLRNLRKLCD